MEETDVCHSIPVARALQQAIPNYCAAKTLGPGERLTLGVQALAGHHTITGLADEAEVSRKFVYQQAAIAQTALDDAFAASEPDDQVLFWFIRAQRIVFGVYPTRAYLVWWSARIFSLKNSRSRKP